MVEVPDETFARYVIEAAKEWGDYGDIHDNVPGSRGTKSMDWSLNDLDPEECSVDMLSETKARVGQKIQASWWRQTSKARLYPNSKAHPAEGVTKFETLMVELIADFSDGLPRVTINAER